MDNDFFRTRMGWRYYEATMPKIADQLERLATAVEALNETLTCKLDRLTTAVETLTAAIGDQATQ